MGLADLPLKKVNLLINTNYNFSAGNWARQAQFLQVYYSDPELSRLGEERDTIDKAAMQIYHRKEGCILGLDMGTHIIRNEMYMPMSYVDLNGFSKNY